MATSTVPAVMASLLTLLRARPVLAAVQIEWGTPSGEPSNDLIILGNVQHSELSRTTAVKRREEYTIDVMVTCIANGTDAQALATHAYALAAEIEQVLTGDPKLSGALTSGWAVTSGMPLLQLSTTTQMEARITMQIAVVALK